MRDFFIRWLITTVAVLAAAHMVHGIWYDNLASLLVASLALGFVNAFLKPFLMLVSLPLLLLTFGLFMLVINGGLLLLVGKIVHGFHVDGWGSAFWGALVVSIVTIVLKSFQSRPRIAVRSVKIEPQRPPSGKGRVIDV